MPKIYPIFVKKTTISGAPTAVVGDDAGTTETLTTSFISSDTNGVSDSIVLTAQDIDDVGASDAEKFQFTPQDALGSPDALTSVTASPTVLDDVGLSDGVLLTTKDIDSIGAGDTAVVQFKPQDSSGASDSVSWTASETIEDDAGGSDALFLEVTEQAMTRSGSPDNDPWGDSWVDRLLANQNVNHGSETIMTVSAVTALSETDSFTKIDFHRFTSFSDDGAKSTITIRALWPSVVLSPNATLQVDFQSSSSSPFIESTITAANRARFTSSSPYSQRTFVFAQDGAARDHVITLSAAETNDLLASKWLMLQITVPDLTLGGFSINPREFATSAQRTRLHLFYKR